VQDNKSVMTLCKIMLDLMLCRIVHSDTVQDVCSDTLKQCKERKILTHNVSIQNKISEFQCQMGCIIATYVLVIIMQQS